MHTFYTVVLLLALATGSFAQEVYLINSLADDPKAHPYDDPATSVDETMDGKCRDENGRCTLRAAVEEARNRHAAAKFIFNVSGTIDLSDQITIDDNCQIDGNHQITLSGIACLELQNFTRVTGVKFSNFISAVSVVGKRNQIGDFPGYNEFGNGGVCITVDGDDNKIFNNYIGITSADELQPVQAGILVTGVFNWIGDGDPGDGNFICGSRGAGIELGEGSNTVIRGNYIGTNITGTAGLGNDQGITIGGSQYNIIGGYGDNDPNVISGNKTAGVVITAVPPDNFSLENYVINNVIGLNALETAAIPNGKGVWITNGVLNNYIEDNIIAGNATEGISIFAYDTTSFTLGHCIGGNRIGLNGGGKLFPNGADGISIAGWVEKVFIGFDYDLTVRPNIIAGNTQGGISIQSMFGFSPSGITVQHNEIFQNGQYNLTMDASSNKRIRPVSGLSLHSNTLAGIHDVPNSTIDVYKTIPGENHASAYKWLGSTTTGANGVFAFSLTDPSVKAVSVTATTAAGNTSTLATLELLTSAKPEPAPLPTAYSLEQNYPNPFNPSTTIRWQTPQNGWLSVKVFDVLGHEVATLVDGYRPAGSYEIEFSAAGGTALPMPSGVYFYTLHAGTVTITKRMVLIK